MKHTIESVRNMRPCPNYQDDDYALLKQLFNGRESISDEEVLELDISDKDKVWFFCQQKVMHVDDRNTFIKKAAERAIKHANTARAYANAHSADYAHASDYAANASAVRASSAARASADAANAARASAASAAHSAASAHAAASADHAANAAANAANAASASASAAHSSARADAYAACVAYVHAVADEERALQVADIKELIAERKGQDEKQSS